MLTVGNPVTISGHAAIHKHKHVNVSVSCAVTPCTITVTVTVIEKGKHGLFVSTGEFGANKKKSHKRKTLTLASGTFKIKTGGPHVLKVKLTGRAVNT